MKHVLRHGTTSNGGDEFGARFDCWPGEALTLYVAAGDACDQAESTATPRSATPDTVCNAAVEPLDTASMRVSPGGACHQTADGIEIRFVPTSDASVYECSYPIGEPRASNRFLAELALADWRSISYLAVGFMADGQFCHVKVPHPPGDQFFNVDFVLEDIVYRLGSTWEPSGPVPAGALRIFVKGEPNDAGAAMRIRGLGIGLRRDSDNFPLRIGGQTLRFRDLPSSWDTTVFSPPDEALLDVLLEYDRRCCPRYEDAAAAMLCGQGLALSKLVSLAWTFSEPEPPALAGNTSFRYAWHALNPAQIMLLGHRDTGKLGYLFGARSLVECWLQANLYRRADDLKYAWYDHSVAERQLVFLKLWIIGLQEGFEARFMMRLLHAIYAQGRLLSCEAFYARDQRTRYHNHALFQDLALFASHRIMPELLEARKWREVAMQRLRSQVDELVVEDQGYAVFVENSPGYHQGAAEIFRLASRIFEECDERDALRGNYAGMLRFSETIAYPGGRTPAIGDTYRRANSEEEAVRARGARAKDGWTPGIVSLGRAGYAIVRGDGGGGDPYQLTFYGPSLSATHKHPDNLAFCLFFDGVEWFIDPSFFSHEYEELYPAYFRSPEAHNAMVLPGLPYSLAPGLCRIETVVDGDSFSLRGDHAGHERGTVRREITGSLSELHLRGEDWAETSVGPSAAVLYFHLGETVQVASRGSRLHLSTPLSTRRLVLDVSHSGVELYTGHEHNGTLCGWSATGFQVAHPITTVRLEVETGAPATWSIRAV
jgi:hypothetical protein